jgi:hypothetical protein
MAIHPRPLQEAINALQFPIDSFAIAFSALKWRIARTAAAQRNNTHWVRMCS